MADQMTRQEFTEYMTAFERRLDARFDGIDTRFGGIDTRFGGIEGRLDRIDGRLDQHDRRFDALDQRLDQHDRGFDRLDASLADLKQEMKVQFEQTRQEFKFSLEAVDALREVTETRFDKMSQEQAVHKADLERAIKNISVPTAQVEGQAKPRARRPASSARRRRG